MPYVNEIIAFMQDIARESGMDSSYIAIVMKIIAIAYLSTFVVIYVMMQGSQY